MKPSTSAVWPDTPKISGVHSHFWTDNWNTLLACRCSTRSWCQGVGLRRFVSQSQFRLTFQKYFFENFLKILNFSQVCASVSFSTKIFLLKIFLKIQFFFQVCASVTVSAHLNCRFPFCKYIETSKRPFETPVCPLVRLYCNFCSLPEICNANPAHPISAQRAQGSSCLKGPEEPSF